MSKPDELSESELFRENQDLKRRISDLERMLQSTDNHEKDPLDEFKRELQDERAK